MCHGLNAILNCDWLISLVLIVFCMCHWLKIIGLFFFLKIKI